MLLDPGRYEDDADFLGAGAAVLTTFPSEPRQ
jgi:hypothetical protein